MRHKLAHRKLNRSGAHRKALFSNMANSLLYHESIRTTLMKAKELRSYVEKLITLGKKGDLHSRRLALSRLKDKKSVALLFDKYKERFKDRKGGYTRIVKLGFRRGDSAPMSVIEFMPDEKALARDEKKKDSITSKIKETIKKADTPMDEIKKDSKEVKEVKIKKEESAPKKTESPEKEPTKK